MLPSEGLTSKISPRRFVYAFFLLYLLAAAILFTPRSYAQNTFQNGTPGQANTRDLVVTSVSPGSRVTLSGHHPSWASAQNDLGAVPADLPLDQLALVLARSAQQQQAFDQFLSAQQDPASPDYHHWLTSVEIGQRFGATQHDIDAITNWLQSQNLHVDSVANSRMRIRFSGTASAVANALGAEMHYFQVNGEQWMSIAAEPQIPAALATVIQSIHGLYTVKIVPTHGMGIAQVPGRNAVGSTGGVAPDFTTSGGNHYLFPSDFAKIYDVNVGSITGAGQTIAVIGTSRVYPTDITDFQSLSGLTSVAPTVIIPPSGTDPGAPETTPPPNNGTPSPSQGEATLDVSRAASIAPGATIDLVISGNGIDIPIEYVVDTNPVPAQVMTISFGACENQASQGTANFFNSLFSDAAMEGISVFVSSGDAGAAGCDTYFATPPTNQTLSTNVICSSSYVTCTGGTEFADSSVPSQYWSSTNGANFESALSYIPEGGWNEPGTANAPVAAASGGGFSIYEPTPSWQIGTGVPGTQGRYTPDVAFSSAAHDGYFACFAAAGSTCSASSIGSEIIYFLGTSAVAPDMAGIAALLNQKVGSAQGNLNPRLYALAAMPSNNVFHDVTVASSAVSNCAVTVPSMCNNSTPGPTSQSGGLSGYLVDAGYDEVTGLGSIDVANLLANWVSTGTNSTTTTLTSNLNPSTVGAPVMFTATVTSTASGTPTGSVVFLDNSVSIGSGTVGAGGVATLTTSALPAGSDPITAQYGGDSNFTSSTSSVLTQVVNQGVNLDPTTTVIVTSANPSVGGQSILFTATVTSTSPGTPTGAVTFLDNGTSIGTGTLNGSGVATLTTSSLAVASHPITARYGGSATFATSTSSVLTQVVNLAATATALASSVNPSVSGQSILFTATVTTTSSGTPAGTVTFLDNGTSIGTGTLNGSGVATLTTSSLAVASHPITARYGGSATFATSTSSVLTQVVNLAPTTASLVSSLNPSIGDQSVTFTATVTTTSSGTPAGTVTFLDNGTSIGTGTLNGSGVATLTTSSLAVATHPITAHYGGSATFTASTSAAVNQVVNPGFGPVPASLSVTAGQSVPITLTIFGASNLTYTLSCTGLPAKSSCTFSPNPVTPGPPPTGTTVVLTFVTSSSRLPASPSNRDPMAWQIYGISAALAALFAAGMIRWRQFPRRRLAFGVCLGTFALAVVMLGCGGSSSNSGSTYTGTPMGATTFTVTGTSGATTISTPVSITVQ